MDMLIDPAWISTCAHVEQFRAIFEQTSTLKRTFGRYTIPAGFPYTQFTAGWRQRIPLLIRANGTLEIRPGELVFQARPLRLPGNEIHHLQDDMAFTLLASEIRTIERYHAASPLGSQFDILFSRILTRHTGFLSDVLVCVGGVGPNMDRMRHESNQLYTLLRQAAFSGYTSAA